jgi:Kef-type K+ transport system membrane component KefB
MERFINGFLDLLTVTFIEKFGKKPMHLFGLLGTFLFILGFGIIGWLIFAKFYFHQFHMTDRPLFFLSILMMVLGSIFFVSGFLGELIVRNSSIRNDYHIDKTLGVNRDEL